MAGALVTAIGVLSGALTAIDIIPGLLAPHQRCGFFAQNYESTTVRVQASLDSGTGPHTTNGGGTIAAIFVSDEGNKWVGSGLHGNILSGRCDPTWYNPYVPQGSFLDLNVPHSDQNEKLQTPWVFIGGSKDAVCIPYITVTWADGQSYAWLGDAGAQCGMSWYYGNVYVDGSNYKPKCVWLDHWVGQPTNKRHHSMKIKFPDFSGDHEDNPVSYLCNKDRFQLWENPASSSKRSVSAAADPRLVISSHPSHSAVELCESETSEGPDLVSLAEGVFCDMETRTVMKLCGEGGGEDCYPVPPPATLARSAGANVTVKAAGKTKSYTKVMEWD